MASTITNFSSNIDVAFPVPGQDNDTQGFRNNFSNIQNSLNAAALEITDLQTEQLGLISQINSIASPENVVATTVLASAITATNVKASGNITAGAFIGDGSQLTNISIGNTFSSLQVAGQLQSGNTNVNGTLTATNVVVKGAVQAAQFVGDGSKLTGIAATTTNLESIPSINLPISTINTKAINVTETVKAQFFEGDGSKLINLPSLEIDTLPKLGVTGNLSVGGTLNVTGNLTSSADISGRNLTLNGRLSVTTATASYFVGDGSGLTNVQLSNFYSNTPVNSVKTKNLTLVDSTNAVASSVYIDNQKAMYVTDVSKIVVVSTLTTTASLSSWSGNTGTFDINSLTFATLPGTVGSGANDYNVFKLWPADPEFHPVSSVVGNTVTTTAFDISNALNIANVGVGSTVTFYKTNSPSIAMYSVAEPTSLRGQAGDKKGMSFATEDAVYVCYQDYTNGATDIWARTTSANAVASAPATSKGAAGDKKGMVFANGSYIYVCYQDYTDGVANIWARSSVTGATW